MRRCLHHAQEAILAHLNLPMVSRKRSFAHIVPHAVFECAHSQDHPSMWIHMQPLQCLHQHTPLWEYLSISTIAWSFSSSKTCMDWRTFWRNSVLLLTMIRRSTSSAYIQGTLGWHPGPVCWPPFIDVREISVLHRQSTNICITGGKFDVLHPTILMVSCLQTDIYIDIYSLVYVLWSSGLHWIRGQNLKAN